MFLGRKNGRGVKISKSTDKRWRRQRVSRGMEKAQPGREQKKPQSTRQSHFQGVRHTLFLRYGGRKGHRNTPFGEQKSLWKVGRSNEGKQKTLHCNRAMGLRHG